MTPRSDVSTPKHRQLYVALERGIRGGRWKPGERLPSEAQLVREFGHSRITVGRAVRDLQLAGLVERRAGSGTFVRAPAAAPAPSSSALSFGLLIPDLGETEIFEPICQGMMASPQARSHALLWGSPREPGASRAESATRLCRSYIERKVDGVFFAPLELAPGKDAVNRAVLAALDAARIPVVLLDRPAEPYPRRGAHDLCGLDNRHAGFVVTSHLVARGARRVAFAARPDSAATIELREAGYREALHYHGLRPARTLEHRLQPDDPAAVRALLAAPAPDAIVCGNDRFAAHLLHTLLRLGVRVPDDVRLCGIDDADYAALLPTPLTTLRQPTRAIGVAALSAMLDRVAQGDELPTRDILLHGTLVVRQSCGSAPPRAA